MFFSQINPLPLAHLANSRAFWQLGHACQYLSKYKDGQLLQPCYLKTIYFILFCPADNVESPLTYSRNQKR